MKGKKVENFCNKIRLTGCKWSGLNAQRSETPMSHPVLTFTVGICILLPNGIWRRVAPPILFVVERLLLCRSRQEKAERRSNQTGIAGHYEPKQT